MQRHVAVGFFRQGDLENRFCICFRSRVTGVLPVMLLSYDFQQYFMPHRVARDFFKPDDLENLDVARGNGQQYGQSLYVG
jgi:hypothetical protein